jgi:hypothetical protein
MDYMKAVSKAQDHEREAIRQVKNGDRETAGATFDRAAHWWDIASDISAQNGDTIAMDDAMESAAYNRENADQVAPWRFPG